jgi:arylsulfatase A-like enzyme
MHYYEELIKVPLIIKYPRGYVKPRISEEIVSLMDVVPTILDFYGVETPGFVQGDSLLSKQSKRKPYVISEASSQTKQERKMIRSGDMKYIITMQKPFRRGRMNVRKITERNLYDLGKDPLEKNDLAKNPAFRDMCLGLERSLLEIISYSASLNKQEGEVELSEETLEHLRALGYIK